MRALLRYANSAEVARGLTQAGYPVSGPTVSRWAKGNNVTPLAVRHVEDLLGETRKAPRPDWAEELVAEVKTIRQTVESEAIGLAALRALLEAIQGQLGPLPDDPVDDPPPPVPVHTPGR